LGVLYIVFSTSWPLVQMSPTDFGASLCVIKKPRGRGGHSPHWAAEAEKIINIALTDLAHLFLYGTITVYFLRNSSYRVPQCVIFFQYTLCSPWNYKSRSHNTKAGPFTHTPAHKYHAKQPEHWLISTHIPTNSWGEKNSTPLHTIYNLWLRRLHAPKAVLCSLCSWGYNCW
jgi:hypothetical protein